MGQYEVKYQIRTPQGRNPQTGAVKYGSSGYYSSPVTVTASSPEEARKIATKSPEVTKARNQAAKRLDHDMPKPRVKIMSVKPSGGGGGGGGFFDLMDRDEMPRLARGGLVKKMKGGGCVMSGRGTKFRGVR